MTMKLNDLVQKILDNAVDNIIKDHSTLKDRPELTEKMVLEIKLNINGERYTVVQLDGIFDGKYFDESNSLVSTTLPQYQDHFVRDYTVEYNCKMSDGNVFTTVYVNVKLEKRYYPTVFEFMDKFVKHPLFKEDNSEYYIVYKKKKYFLTPKVMFKFRNYTVRKITSTRYKQPNPLKNRYDIIKENWLFVKE